MGAGYFALVLHAHLPFVRPPDDPTVMEERWLYEAIVDTYLPLLQMFEGLARDGVPFRCTVSLSAPLISMLTAHLLKERAASHRCHQPLLAVLPAPPHRHASYQSGRADFYHDRFQS